VPSASAAGTTVYFNDFEAGGELGDEVHFPRHVSKLSTSTGRQFAGGVFASDPPGAGGSSFEVWLEGFPAHGSLRVSFDVYVIGRWRGGDDVDVPVVNPPESTFGLAFDPYEVEEFVDWPLQYVNSWSTGFTFSTTDGGRQSYPQGAAYEGAPFPARTGAVESNTLGYGEPGDTVYHVSTVAPHTATKAKLWFSASLHGEDAFWGWGVDNLRVEVLSEIVWSGPSLGREIFAAGITSPSIDSLAVNTPQVATPACSAEACANGTAVGGESLNTPGLEGFATPPTTIPGGCVPVVACANPVPVGPIGIVPAVPSQVVQVPAAVVPAPCALVAVVCQSVMVVPGMSVAGTPGIPATPIASPVTVVVLLSGLELESAPHAGEFGTLGPVPLTVTLPPFGTPIGVTLCPDGCPVPVAPHAQVTAHVDIRVQGSVAEQSLTAHRTIPLEVGV
jgi:hypothetical protein